MYTSFIIQFLLISVGKSCTHAIILAQLVIDGERHGMHPFMVQLRSLEDHSPMPGTSWNRIEQNRSEQNRMEQNRIEFISN